MSKCSVRMCDTTSEKECFDFPLNIALERKWWHFLKVCNGKVDRSRPLKICEKHFKPSEVLKGFSVTLLVPGAVPTIAVIKKNDIEEIGKKPGVTIQPKIYQTPTIVRVKKSKAISQVCKESGMCGSCLVVTGTPMNKIPMASAIAFKEITEFETLSDFICDSCSVSLRNYIVFKSVVKQKHKQIRDDLERSNFMGRQLDDMDPPSNLMKQDPLSKFSCKRCEFKTATIQLLRVHESSKHPEFTEQQQPFQKIQIQVADEDYDFMAQILNRNQLQQVKITENSSAAYEESSSSDMHFKITKVDSWAVSEPGPSQPQETFVNKKKRKITSPPNAANDVGYDGFMPESELIMHYAQNYKKLEEFVDEEVGQSKKPKLRNAFTEQPQRHHENRTFYCDLCGHSSSKKKALIEHIHLAHSASANATEKGSTKNSVDVPADVDLS